MLTFHTPVKIVMRRMRYLACARRFSRAVSPKLYYPRIHRGTPVSAEWPCGVPERAVSWPGIGANHGGAQRWQRSGPWGTNWRTTAHSGSVVFRVRVTDHHSMLLRGGMMESEMHLKHSWMQ